MERNKKRVFSGIQPSGDLHLGNYVGAIKQWVALQDEYECIFSIVDLHAITVPYDPALLKERIRRLAALYLACGIDPQKAVVFVQSHNPDHPVLAWLLDCVASMGQLRRMTQYKAKAEKLKEKVTVGLFNYPALMAADILLYQTDVVPVGEDQKQHVELTRDLAEKFNARFGETFKLPEVKILQVGARVMSLQNPSKKMSKSAEDPNGTIDLLDSPEEIVRKVKSAVTDSGREIVFDRENKPGISNLLAIYANLSGKKIEKLEEEYQGKGYGEFKTDLADLIVETLRPIQERYQKIRKEEDYLESLFQEGLRKVKPISEATLKKVYERMGLG
ncbi:tryptophan--tRNA ligase [bacterium]|nr:tryptophan--tRNA ligase [bacterium]